MAKAGTHVAVKSEGKSAAAEPAAQTWRPFESLRREIDRLFEDFTLNPLRLPLRRPAFDVEPFWQPDSWLASPAINLVERDDEFEVTADLPGLDEKNIEVSLSNGVLTIKGEKEEAKEEEKENYHLQERRFGSVARSIRIPEGADLEKIKATFKNGVLTVALPKTSEAKKSAKKIEVKPG